MIEVKNINKTFGNKDIFKDYSLTINDGDFILITGHSGCGKTTLLNMIGSIEKPTSGDILVDGQSIYDKKYQLKYLREKVGFLFQNFALSDGDTVISNFKLVKKNSRTDMSYQKALSFVNLNDDVLKQKVYTLSGGEQQRVAIARLLIKKCDIILADEPTASLDRKNACDIFDLLTELNKKGKTIIVASHDMSFKDYAKTMIELN